jgi:hypothetical protein
VHIDGRQLRAGPAMELSDEQLNLMMIHCQALEFQFQNNCFGLVVVVWCILSAESIPQMVEDKRQISFQTYKECFLVWKYITTICNGTSNLMRRSGKIK